MHDEAEAARNNPPEQAHQVGACAPHEGPSARDIEALLTNEAIPAHVRSLVGLLSEGNVKLDEALALKVGDVIPTRREIPVSEQTLRLLREAIGDREQGPLFATPSGQRMSRGAIATQVRNTTRYGTHDIRPGGHRDRPSGPRRSSR
ncbi:hypothetical protein SHL15_5607 [Streptomyces hygroscopicus subsp. limoneus]|nr:hypothetical protein SHL15_5607 [Streptomyces hygroscopicus subsp. limoneus]